MAFSCAIGLGMLFTTWLLDGFTQSSFKIRMYWVFAIFCSVLLAFCNSITKGHTVDLKALNLQAGLSDDGYHQAKKSLFCWTNLTVIYSTIIGVLLSGVHLWSTGDISNIAGFYSKLSILDFWMYAQVFFSWILFAQIGAIFFRNLSLFYRLGSNIKINLFNIQVLAPFIKSGIRIFLAIACPFALGFLMMGNASAEMWITPLVVFVFLAVLLPIIPVWKIHMRITQEKEKTLNCIQRAIAGDTEAMNSTIFYPEAATYRKLDLLSLKKSVENIEEWPLSFPLFIRWIFLLLLPLITWVASAFVDNIIESIM